MIMGRPAIRRSVISLLKKLPSAPSMPWLMFAWRSLQSFLKYQIAALSPISSLH